VTLIEPMVQGSHFLEAILVCIGRWAGFSSWKEITHKTTDRIVASESLVPEGRGFFLNERAGEPALGAFHHVDYTEG